MKKFDVPLFYRSSLITEIKNFRRDLDSRKKDFRPTVLDFGPVKFLLARHFGFCYGVENAIEISYKAIEENPDQRIFLLSEMIHNPDVNRDLLSRGVRFIMHTSGEQIVPWEELKADDIVIVPAFGTTLEIQNKLSAIGIQSHRYDTTCPFVEKVWNKAAAIGQEQYTVVIHGKPSHEETRATFSHSKETAPTVVVRDMHEAEQLADVLLGYITPQEFYNIFKEQHSAGFDVARDLKRIGVVNQTTMLAAETQAIADFLKHAMIKKFNVSESGIGRHFADTRDTLCYATNDNQNAIYGLLREKADLAIVAGGYNSSNTSHLYELCEKQLSTYYISSADRIVSKDKIHRFDFHRKTETTAEDFLPSKKSVAIMLASGASCPDVIVENIMWKILSFFEDRRNLDDVMADFKRNYSP